MCIVKPTLEAASKPHLSHLSKSLDASEYVEVKEADPGDSGITVGGGRLEGVTGAVIVVVEVDVVVTEAVNNDFMAVTGTVPEGVEQALDAEAAEEAWAA